jgi:hypothetical protein
MQRKAMTRLMGLQFKVVYKKGKDNLAADALSRVCHLIALQAVSEVTPKWMQEVLNSYSTDCYLNWHSLVLMSMAIHLIKA